MKYVIVILSLIILYQLLDKETIKFSSDVAKNSPAGMTAELMRFKYMFLKKTTNLDGWSAEEIAYYEKIKAKQSEILFEALTTDDWRDAQVLYFVSKKFKKNIEIKSSSEIDKRLQETVKNIIEDELK